ncbi:toxin [Candidatus Poribacteria bacterium]|nr:toxin [Candidatus Poribacteria bacterium]
MRFDWNPDKNKWLKKNRGINFDEITCLIENEHLKTILNHPKKAKQKIFVVEHDGYAYNVPFIEDKNEICFLKTIYPSRSSTKKYLRR